LILDHEKLMATLQQEMGLSHAALQSISYAECHLDTLEIRKVLGKNQFYKGNSRDTSADLSAFEELAKADSPRDSYGY
jgi:hypothetical protein